MSAVREAAPELGVAPACLALKLPRATFYRHEGGRAHSSPVAASSPSAPRGRSSRQPRALSLEARARVRGVLCSERFVDQSPAEIHATLLEEEIYHCSVRTMYRILGAEDPVRERRDQLRHPAYAKPELLATRPNQLWSWDITKLLGPGKVSGHSSEPSPSRAS